MHTAGDVQVVLSLSNDGLNHCAIARQTGVPRSTVRDWLSGSLPNSYRAGSSHARCGCHEHPPVDQHLFEQYSYLLGMYLGDGCISRHPRGVFRLRITLDNAYPGIINECQAAMSNVLPRSKVGVYPHPHQRATEVGSYSKGWPCFFPQHGVGPKWKRRISLAQWQEEIVTQHPRPFLRGLIHSDGWRGSNRVNGKDYPRYQFSNNSLDIQALFCAACDQLEIEWTKSYWKTISIAKADSVRQLDAFIGLKR